ncbi:MAG: hypothetical protein IJ748_00310 [Bacteroidales bacterium]|nr:hypothetical protein [Bacteroidales bacterium]
MKKILLAIIGVFFTLNLFSQTENDSSMVCYPYIFTKDYAVVGINAKTTDKELLEIRKNILKYTSIRFTNFDVIRGKDGDIYFLSMEVDCRDGYSGKISHAFEPGDGDYYGFIRDFTKEPDKIAFYMGNLSDEKSCIKHVNKNIKEKNF